MPYLFVLRIVLILSFEVIKLLSQMCYVEASNCKTKNNLIANLEIFTESDWIMLDSTC